MKMHGTTDLLMYDILFYTSFATWLTIDAHVIVSASYQDYYHNRHRYLAADRASTFRKAFRPD